jgi:hypothetical protein
MTLVCPRRGARRSPRRPIPGNIPESDRGRHHAGEVWFMTCGRYFTGAFQRRPAFPMPLFEAASAARQGMS